MITLNFSCYRITNLTVISINAFDEYLPRSSSFPLAVSLTMKSIFGRLSYSIWSYRSIRVAIGLVFIVSGAGKMLDPNSFAVVIDAFGLLPAGWSLVVAFVLVILELASGLALIFDIQGSLSVISGLLLLFMAILIYGIQMGLDVDCGCFGPEDPEAEAFHNLRSALNRDFIILGGVFYLYFWRYRMNAVSLRLMEMIIRYRQWRTI